MTKTRNRIPAHLRRYVVDQNYDAYDEIDQAVWRFVLLQTYERLKETAHPAYVEGLRQTGISVDRIPRIEEMDRCLSDYGWGAVVVDGFIPPRAFQEFQARGIMTIAAAIRRRRHLAYTPAPDIIHESAGHAPIIPDPTYREYLRRFGEIGARAFSSQEDLDLYEAIRHLSEVKEERTSTPQIIEAVQRRMQEAAGAVSYATEASLLSRLHWWTVEYGLVGKPNDYKIYGAGILSSLGESHFCHDPSVRKIPLSVDCTDVGYDITKPQPQLFVASDFDQLSEVLDEFAQGLAQRRGGLEGLQTMLRSKELGTIELDSGVQITGTLSAVQTDDADPAYLRLSGECSLALDGQTLANQTRAEHRDGYGCAVGRLEDGRGLSELQEEDLLRLRDPANPDRLRLRYRSGVEITGKLRRRQCDESGRLLVLCFDDCTVSRGGERLFDPAWGIYDLAVGESVRSCFAGAADPDYYPPTDFSHRAVPTAKSAAAETEETRVRGLYGEALEAWRMGDGNDLVGRFARIEDRLSEKHPDEWLLRWNLLESLVKLRQGDELQRRLREELLEIEKTAPHELPISTGLRYLHLA